MLDRVLNTPLVLQHSLWVLLEMLVDKCVGLFIDAFNYLYNSHWRCSIKRAVLKNCARFIVKHVLESPFNKVATKVATFFIKKMYYRCFPLNIANFLRTFILKNIGERLLFYLEKIST